MSSGKDVLSEYWRAIILAAEQGYIGNPETGEITGRSGRPLQIKRHGNQVYPTIRLYVRGLSAPGYSVHAHKFFAYLIWGRAAFSPNVEVRHLDGNPSNNRRDNLALGTSSQNQMDKTPEARRSAAVAARAAQGRHGSARLSEEKAALIRAELSHSHGPKGRVRRGVVKSLAQRFSVSQSTISLIGKGRTWNA